MSKKDFNKKAEQAKQDQIKWICDNYTRITGAPALTSNPKKDLAELPIKPIQKIYSRLRETEEEQRKTARKVATIYTRPR